MSNPNLQFLTASERASLLAETDSYRRAMDQCDFVITSTPAMKELASQSAEYVYIWRNAVDAETRHWAEVARNNPSSRTEGTWWCWVTPPAHAPMKPISA